MGYRLIESLVKGGIVHVQYTVQCTVHVQSWTVKTGVHVSTCPRAAIDIHDPMREEGWNTSFRPR
jgi:hypothetical protein